MLRLRARQVNQLGRTHFVDRANEHLRRNHPDFVAIGPTLGREFVETTVRAATGTYGLTSQRAVMTFVLVTWYLGPDFTEQHPEAEAILRNQNLDELGRASQLYRWAWRQLGEEPS